MYKKKVKSEQDKASKMVANTAAFGVTRSEVLC